MSAMAVCAKNVLLAMLALPALVACGGVASDFLPNTEHGLLELTVRRVANANEDDVTELKSNDRLRYFRPVLARTLPAGVELDVRAAASEFGPYRFGAGWITHGNLYLGRHEVPTEIVNVVSSDVRVVAAELVRDPADPGRWLARLKTREPGTVRLTFTVSKLDEKRQRIDAIAEDSISITVARSPAVRGNPVLPMLAK
jgi:hypothetical protein